MRAVEGTNVHAEIIGMIDRAEQFVVLVSPFVRPWPDFTKALARAVLRGVSLQLVCGHTVKDADLGVFDRLEIPCTGITDLHAKLYVTEREAMTTSVNLTKSSLERSVENGTLADRTAEPEAWFMYFEQYQQILDYAAQPKRPHRTDPALRREYLMGDRQALVERGDPAALATVRYCIGCGEVSSYDDTAVACVRCIAQALADGEYEVRGKQCTVCKAPHKWATEERPRCPACYKRLLDSERQQPRAWAVRGREGQIEAWYAVGEVEDAALARDAPLRSAVARRSPFYLKGADALHVKLRTTVVTPPLSLFGTTRVAIEAIPKVTRVAIERVHEATAPPKTLTAPEGGVLHVSCTGVETVGAFEAWTEKDPLATVTISGVPRASSMRRHAAADMLGSGVLVHRKLVAPPDRWPSDRYALAVHMGLSLPEWLWDHWLDLADSLLPKLIAALHQHAPADVAALTGKSAAEDWALRLSEPAPLGPVPSVWHGNGKLARLGGEDHRVAALFIVRVPSADDHVGLVARVATITRPTVH